LASHNDFGKKAEDYACEYLIKKKYQILQRNYRFKKSEVDIIAKHRETLIIVEVKARSSNYFGNPQDFIGKKKIQLLVEAVNNYITINNLDIEVRFDIVSILKNNDDFLVEHLEDAFYIF
jgi:putative endonuclease